MPCFGMRPRRPTTGLPPAWAVLLLLCLPAGCIAGVNGDLPVVEGPVPRPEPAPDIAGESAVLHLPKPWLLYSRPPELYGMPVLRPEGGTTWRVTGRWRADGDHLTGYQPWVLMGKIPYTWYRLTGPVAPWGDVHLWGQLPDDWVPDREAVPHAAPVPGTPWRTVPYSLGHVLEPVRGRQLSLRACPAADCPVLERPEDGQRVPVTGRLTDASGEEWLRVEFRQQILWVEVDSGRLAVSWAGRLRRGGAEAAGYRSCEPVVMFPPPPHTLCPVNAEGRFLDLFEREYDRLDPVFGRLPQHLWEEAPASRTRPSPRPTDPAAEDQQRHCLNPLCGQFVLLGDWTPPADPDIVCGPAFIVTEVSAPLHAGPDAKQPVISTVHRHTPLPVQETRGSWHRVAMAGISPVPDHWVHDDQGQMGGWCIHLWRPEPVASIPEGRPDPPPAAVERIAVARSDGVLTVTWSPVPSALDYHVTYSADGGASWRLGGIEHPDTSIRIAGVDNGQTYIVGVRARNEFEYGPWRNSDPSPPFHPQPGDPSAYIPGDLYPVDLPGLDYEWDLVFEDQSALWDWDSPDHGACHDALRAHLGHRPEWYGLRKATVVLRDPSPDFDWEAHQGGSVHFPREVAWQSGMPADGAMVHVGCLNAHFRMPRHDDGEFVCEVHPLWGHAGTRKAAYRLNGALAQALATYLGYAIYQEEAIKARHWELEGTWDRPPWLYPRDAATGDPVGEGPCLRLTPVAAED